ncbi:hypothetical protein BSKO_11966 [Bryopsis sp. KO-2023]|nr:hypothetical protein BSKO_11966 [Bryopsis sp. KO-2023]
MAQERIRLQEEDCAMGIQKGYSDLRCALLKDDGASSAEPPVGETKTPASTLESTKQEKQEAETTESNSPATTPEGESTEQAAVQPAVTTIGDSPLSEPIATEPGAPVVIQVDVSAPVVEETTVLVEQEREGAGGTMGAGIVAFSPQSEMSVGLTTEPSAGGDASTAAVSEPNADP